MNIQTAIKVFFQAKQVLGTKLLPGNEKIIKKNVLCVLSAVCFFTLSLSAASKPMKSLTMLDLVQPSDELQANSIGYGAWLPLRMQPTKSTTIHQHSTYLSPYNAMTAKKVIAGLMDKKPMLLIRGLFGRIVIGKADGLIYGMRPRILSESFQGSYLCEYAEGWDPKGSLIITEESPEKIVLDWKSANALRRIVITRDGVFKTKWTNGPKNLSLFTGCHPYHFLSVDGKTAVRFSQLLQARRKLKGESNLAMFGYRGAALEIKSRGLKLKAEEIWLDSGEVGWEWLQTHMKEAPKSDKRRTYIPFGDWVRSNAALTYLAGGAIRKLEFTADEDSYTLNYAVSQDGRDVISRIKAAEFKRRLPAVTTESSNISVTVVEDSLSTVRIWPNDFHGWELRPLKLVRINPMPRFYKLNLSNTTDQEKTFEFALKKTGWIKSAILESDPVDYKIGDTGDAKVPEYRQQQFWKNEGKSPSITVSAGSKKQILLKIQPVEETMGDYKFSLNWSSGRTNGDMPLCLRVVPSCMVAPTYYTSLRGMEDSRFFSFTGDSVPAGYLAWGWRGKGSSRAEQDKYLKLAGMNALRKGFWIQDHCWLRNYITAYTQKKTGDKRERYMQVPPDEFVKKLKKDIVNRTARFPYRYRVYLADEIREIIGGYKGRRYMPIPEVTRWTRDIIMDCPTPCWYSFMQAAVDDQYHCKLPNDIAELFYYCGRDEAFRTYVQKLVKPRLKLIEEWKKNPVCMRRAGSKDIKPMFSFWISGQLHVIDYPTMRRQHLYNRHNGIDILLVCTMRYSHMLYANRIGENSFLYAGKGQVMMTDRSLAWCDLREDMEYISLMRMLKEKAKPIIQEKVSVLEKKSYEASQENEFDLARHYLIEAVKMLKPEYTYLVCPDFYQPVKSEALPDLYEYDKQLRGQIKKKITVSMLKGGHRPAPVLDGELDNSYLEEGATLTNFQVVNTFAAPKEATTAYLAWDKKNLYVLFVCNESLMDKLVANKHLPRDKSTWNNDCVELFIDRKRDGMSYSQFIVGAGGTRYDGRTIMIMKNGEQRVLTETVTWNPDWDFIVKRRDKSWSVEMIIPMSAIGGPPKDGEVWGMNFARERKTQKEKSVWSPHEEGFGDPNQFGEIKFQ